MEEELIIRRKGKWKPLKQYSLDKIVNRKQYEIPEGMADINAITRDLNNVGQWSLSHLCLISQPDSLGM